MVIRSEVVGVVISDKMEKSVTVVVERQIRHSVYGKTRRRSSSFLAHDEESAAKVGDRVAMTLSRPISRRKRWIVTRIIERA